MPYNKEHLAICVRELLEKFGQFWEEIDLEKLQQEDDSKRRRIQKVDWNDAEDCFVKLVFDTYCRNNGELAIGLGVRTREGKRYAGGDIISTCSFSGTVEELLTWAKSEKALADCLAKFDEQIDELYRG